MFRFALLITGSCLFLLAGCFTESPTVPGSVSTGSSGDIEIENSHVFFDERDGKLQLLVWKGFPPSAVWELSSGSQGEEIILKDKRTLEWERKPNSDTITVNGTQYSLHAGRLLLLSFAGDEVKVQQLDYDLSTLGSNYQEISERLKKLAEDDETVRAYLDSLEPVE